MKCGLQYTHLTGACGMNDCTIGEAPQKCPSGHSVPFHHTLIGLPEGAEWWFHCHHNDPKEDGWCDERFPGPRIRELFTLLVRPEIYEFIMKEGWFQDEEEEHGPLPV